MSERKGRFVWIDVSHYIVLIINYDYSVHLINNYDPYILLTITNNPWQIDTNMEK